MAFTWGLVVAGAHAQEPPEIKVVRAFAKQMGIPIAGKFTRREVRLPSGMPAKPRMMVDFGPHGFIVQVASKRVGSYRKSDYSPVREAQAGRMKPKFSNAKGWWEHGKETLKRAQLGLPMVPGRFREFLGSQGSNSNMVYLTFEHQPYGVSTGGNGNIASFGYDRTTGELRSYTVRLGSTIMPPTVKISESRAVEIATSHLKKQAPEFVT